MAENQYLKEFIGVDHLPEIGDPGAYGRAVLTVLGADGEISDGELSFFLDHAAKLGFPQVILEELREFDYQNANFEDYSGAIRSSSAAKMLLYDAIRGSMIDEYAESEKEAIAKAAGILGIDDDLLRALEGLAGTETAVRKATPADNLAPIQAALRTARVSLIAPAKTELDVDAIAQAKRFHSPRSGLGGADRIPAAFVQVVKDFQATMEASQTALEGASPDEEAIKQQVLEACQKFQDALLETVNQNPEIDAAIGAFAFRETFRYFMLSSMFDRAYTKPRGYAGDYETMEMIYENAPKGENALGVFVDQWVLDKRMARAVRNRRKLLTKAIADTYAQWDSDQYMPVTSLASGSAREVFDVFSRVDKPKIKLTCTDIDPDVHTFAGAVAAEVGAVENTVFLQDNILKVIRGGGKSVLPRQQLIYAVGLVDYLRDRQVVTMLNWAYEHLLPGGKIIIGQFHPSSPDKPFMDHILDWSLYYRSEDEMRALFARSKFGEADVEIEFEEGGVQMFLTCSKA
jgi:hypothetical protein